MSRNISLRRFYSSTKPAFMYEVNNGVHFGKDSREPVWPANNHLRLYSMRFCPYAARVHLVLNIKRIPYNVCYVELHSKPEWLQSKSPKGRVPALELPNGSGTIIESLIIADFLDEAFPSRALHPADPLQKAKDRLVLDGFVSGFRRVVRLLLGKSTNEGEDAVKGQKMLQNLEKELAGRGSEFFGGSAPGMLDLMIWPWIVKLPMAGILIGREFCIENYKNLERWKDSMLKEEAVQGFYISPEENQKFVAAIAQGVPPPYNMLVAAKAAL